MIDKNDPELAVAKDIGEYFDYLNSLPRISFPKMTESEKAIYVSSFAKCVSYFSEKERYEVLQRAIEREKQQKNNENTGSLE